jgi:hypothetical protein
MGKKLSHLFDLRVVLGQYVFEVTGFVNKLRKTFLVDCNKLNHGNITDLDLRPFHVEIMESIYVLGQVFIHLLTVYLLVSVN